MTSKSHRPQSRYRTTDERWRRLRSWIGIGLLIVFVAGLGHAWLHDAHANDGGHFGMSVDKACPSEQLIADIAESDDSALKRLPFPSFLKPQDKQWVCRLSLAASPRGPPASS